MLSTSAAIARDLARVQPVIDDADAEEERGRDDAVAQHLEHRALQAFARCSVKMPIVTKPIWATDE